MGVTFYIGRAGSGKTKTCYDDIKKSLKEKDIKPILLVPEQFNLQTQKELAKHLYPGLMRAEVLSFNSLARKVFRETGYPKDQVIIDDLERIMILKKILLTHGKTLDFYKKAANKEGFVDALNRMITLCEQNRIKEEDLEQIVKLGESGFESKLKDIMDLNRLFHNYLGEHFVTVEGTMEVLASKICQASTLRHSMIWVDGFYGFTRQQLRILGELIVCCKHVVITLPMDKIYTQEEHLFENNPFFESALTYQKILNLCDEYQIHQKQTYLFKRKHAEHLTDLEILESKFLNYRMQPYTKQSEHIQLKSYGTLREEVEWAAKTIRKKIREEGYRYHDFAIIVGDLAQYQATVKTLFKSYHIPVFIDAKKPIHTHRLITFIEAVLDVVAQDWDYKSVLQMLRTYFLGYKLEEIDLLENYILAHGIKGRKKWRQAWNYAKEETIEKENEELINRLREDLIERLSLVEAALKGTKKRPIKGYVRALYSFLEESNCYESIQEDIVKYETKGNRLLELENRQIWEQMLTVFEKIVSVLGEEEERPIHFKKILQTTFSSLKMGLIPPSEDQVLIGSIDRSRLPKVKMIMLLGVNDGMIPKVEEGTNLFTQVERLQLQTISTENQAAKQFYEMLAKQQDLTGLLDVYTVLTRATNKVYVSCHLQNSEGKPLRPSQVYYKLKKLFPNRIESENEKDQDIDIFESALPAFGYVGRKLREEVDGLSIEDLWKDGLSWYKEQEDWKMQLQKMIDYIFYTNQQHYLEEETTKMLYENPLNTSVSKLEQYRKCPCCYFIKYGLKAQERKLFEWNPVDLGIMFHSIMERYPRELEKRNTTWRNANEHIQKEALHIAVKEAVNTLNQGKREDGKFKYTTKRIEKMASRAVHVLTEHIKSGAFEPKDYEVSFGEGYLPDIQIQIDAERFLVLKGQIDRVDVYAHEGNTYIKILDYKSGKQKFDLLQVYYGLQLQLLLYLDAYMKLHPNTMPAGVFYFHIDNPNTKYEPGMDREAIEQSRMKAFKMSGLVLEDQEIICALEEGGQGKVIPAKLTQKGIHQGFSSVASLEQFKAVGDFMTQMIRQIGKEILEGKVSAMPYKLGGQDPCQYCTYHSICQFDESMGDNMYNELESLSKDEIWEAIEKEGSDIDELE